LDNVKNPLVILLTALSVLSYLTGDLWATVVIFVMVLLGVVLRFYQELRADNAAEKLKAMVYMILTQGVKTWFFYKVWRMIFR
jgi:Mg2+-importing ATPase